MSVIPCSLMSARVASRASRLPWISLMIALKKHCPLVPDLIPSRGRRKPKQEFILAQAPGQVHRLLWYSGPRLTPARNAGRTQLGVQRGGVRFPVTSPAGILSPFLGKETASIPCNFAGEMTEPCARPLQPGRTSPGTPPKLPENNGNGRDLVDRVQLLAYVFEPSQTGFPAASATPRKRGCAPEAGYSIDSRISPGLPA